MVYEYGNGIAIWLETKLDAKLEERRQQGWGTAKSFHLNLTHGKVGAVIKHIVEEGIDAVVDAAEHP